MKHVITQRLIVLVSIIGALVTLLSAYLLKDTEYENAWLYITLVTIVLLPVLETLSRRNQR